MNYKDSKKNLRWSDTCIRSEQHLKKYRMMANMYSYFKKFTFIHDRLALELSRYLEETNILKWMIMGKVIMT